MMHRRKLQDELRTFAHIPESRILQASGEEDFTQYFSSFYSVGLVIRTKGIEESGVIIANRLQSFKFTMSLNPALFSLAA